MMEGIGVCHISTVHRSDDVRIFQKEARSLAKAGYGVAFVVRAQEELEVDGVRIVPLPEPRSRLDRGLRLAWLAYKQALSTRSKIFHLHDPELIPIGLLLKLQGKKVVFDAHEDLPKQILSKPWIPSILRRPLSWAVALFEKVALVPYDAVAAATPSIAKRFSSQKTVVIQNYPIYNELIDQQRLPYSKRPHRVAFIGGITLIRGAHEMVRAVGMVPEELQVRLLLAGHFSPAGLEYALAKEPGWDRVEYVSWLTREAVARELGRSRAGLVLFHPEPNHLDAQPNKIFEYMAAGLPVIASDFPLWREIVEGEEAGLLVDPEDPAAIASAIEWVITHPQEAEAMGQRGREAVRRKYSWSLEEKKLLNLYERLSS